MSTIELRPDNYLFTPRHLGGTRYSANYTEMFGNYTEISLSRWNWLFADYHELRNELGELLKKFSKNDCVRTFSVCAGVLWVLFVLASKYRRLSSAQTTSTGIGQAKLGLYLDG